MREHFARVTATIAFTALISGAAAAAEPKAIYGALRAARPDGPAVSVTSLAIEREIPKEPKRALLNAQHEVLARD